MSYAAVSSLRKESLFKAIVTRRIVKAVDKYQQSTPEAAFVIGLLSSIGNLPLLGGEPHKHYSNNLEADKLPWDIQQQLLESKSNQFTYTFDLLNSWDFPKEITLPIKHILQYRHIDTNPYIKALYASNLLALSFIYPEYFKIADIIEHDVFSILGLKGDCLIKLYKEAIETTSLRLFTNITPVSTKIIGVSI